MSIEQLLVVLLSDIRIQCGKNVYCGSMIIVLSSFSLFLGMVTWQ